MPDKRKRRNGHLNSPINATAALIEWLTEEQRMPQGRLAALDKSDKLKKQLIVAGAKLHLLLQEYEIQEDKNRWFKLAMLLAIEHEAGFQIYNKRGRKVDWSDETTGVLVVEVERLRAQGKASIVEAARQLSRKADWKTFLRRSEFEPVNAVETLRARYTKRRSSPAAKRARQLYEQIKTRPAGEAAWEQHVTDTITGKKIAPFAFDL